MTRHTDKAHPCMHECPALINNIFCAQMQCHAPPQALSTWGTMFAGAAPALTMREAAPIALSRTASSSEGLNSACRACSRGTASLLACQTEGAQFEWCAHPWHREASGRFQKHAEKLVLKDSQPGLATMACLSKDHHAGYQSQAVTEQQALAHQSWTSTQSLCKPRCLLKCFHADKQRWLDGMPCWFCREVRHMISKRSI